MTSAVVSFPVARQRASAGAEPAGGAVRPPGNRRFQIIAIAIVSLNLFAGIADHALSALLTADLEDRILSALVVVALGGLSAALVAVVRRQGIGVIFERLGARKDTEHQQALIRLTGAFLIYLYLGINAALTGFDMGPFRVPTLLVAGYELAVLALLVWMLLAHNLSPARRILAN